MIIYSIRCDQRLVAGGRTHQVPGVGDAIYVRDTGADRATAYLVVGRRWKTAAAHYDDDMWPDGADRDDILSCVLFVERETEGESTGIPTPPPDTP